MMKNIIVLGSTGSIGVQVLDIVSRFPDRFRVVGLAAGFNEKLLIKQIHKHSPTLAAIFDLKKSEFIKWNVQNKCKILSGIEGVKEVALYGEGDMVVSAISGAAGLLPTFAAIRANKKIALANKETLVMAGELIIEEARKNKVKIVPVDSEHSAIFQAIEGHNKKEIEKLILTASGGPFFKNKRKNLKNVTPSEALNHPNWEMGKKISIDSATLMNKGLEVIEARWLFGISPSKIEVQIHPESIIHSMVEYIDGSVIAQLAVPDMRIPIAYALAYPSRLKLNFGKLNFTSLEKLTFEKPDNKRFPSLSLAYSALAIGRTMPAVLNAANEIAVDSFISGRIKFSEIPALVEKTMNAHNPFSAGSIESVLEADAWSRKYSKSLC